MGGLRGGGPNRGLLRRWHVDGCAIVVGTVFGKRGQHVGSEEEKPKLKVMVVDDEALVAEMLKTLFKSSGYQTGYAAPGQGS